MKKVLKLIVLVAVISALTLVAFAAQSPELKDIPDESGSSELIDVVAEIPEGITVEVTTPTNAAANVAAAEAAGDEIEVVLDSFDVIVTEGVSGEVLHEGPTVTLTLNVGAQYAGYTLKLYETSADGETRLAASAIVPEDGIVVITINRFSTFTPILVKPAAVPAPGPVSPQTMQTLLPIALAVLAVAAVAVAVIARKRSFN